jgi:hypothetical protein
MTLDVETPAPPPIGGRPVDPDPDHDRESQGAPESTPWADDPPAGAGRRDAIAAVLAEGAWTEGFEAWAADTHLTAAEFAVLRDHDLLAGFDFHCDPETESVRYRAPEVPEAVARDLRGEDTQEVRDALDALGREVAGVVESDYLVREEGVFEFSSGDTDPEFRDTE